MNVMAGMGIMHEIPSGTTGEMTGNSIPGKNFEDINNNNSAKIENNGNRDSSGRETRVEPLKPNKAEKFDPLKERPIHEELPQQEGTVSQESQSGDVALVGDSQAPNDLSHIPKNEDPAIKFGEEDVNMNNDEVVDSASNETNEKPTQEDNEDEIIDTDVKEEKKGGSYADVKKTSDGSTHEVHHMPADNASNLERDDGPAIRMEKEDHRKTASCGNSREAREYREKQRKLIEEGKFREALQMDIDDIHEKFGDKYDEEIAEMLEYVDKLEKEGKINE